MNTETIKLPSGFSITYREMNGEDEICLSQVENIKNGTQLNLFLSRIITDTDNPAHKDDSGNQKRKYTPEEIGEWPLANKYYAALRARIFSLGNELHFKYKHQGETIKDPMGIEYDQDLNEYVAPLERWEELTQEELDALSPVSIKPYPAGAKTQFEFTTSSGLLVRWSLLSSYGEKNILAKLRGELSKNDDFISRQLETKTGDKWFPVGNFRNFSSRDLAEIRGEFKKYDVNFAMPIEITSKKTGKVDLIPAIALEEFFFPTTIQSL
jgi:hypothetical protein